MLVGARIIEPLASRCSKFRFKPLDSNSTEKRVEMIREAENVKMDDGVGAGVNALRRGHSANPLENPTSGPSSHFGAFRR